MSQSLSPVNDITRQGALPRWTLLGPFPNSVLDMPLSDGTQRGGLDSDYLVSIGGEERAIPLAGPMVAYRAPDGHITEAVPIASMAQPNGNIDLATAYPGRQFHVAYAFCYLKSSSTQRLYAYFGSKDGAKIWVNGGLAHRIWTRRRAVRPWTDSFVLPVHKGINRILVKVENSGNEWAFVLEVYQEADHLAAIREHMSSLVLELGARASGTDPPELPLRVHLRPPVLLPPVPISIAIKHTSGGERRVILGHTCQSIRADLSEERNGFIELTARLSDARLPAIQGKSLVYLGDAASVRRELRSRIAGHCGRLARRTPPGSAASVWEKAHLGVLGFARWWLELETERWGDAEIRLLRDFQSLAESCEIDHSYLAERLGRLHPIRYRPPSRGSCSPGHYLVYLPKEYGQPGQRWPLLVFLSGAGAVGSDINRLTQHDLIKRLVRDRDYPLLVAAPQCPTGVDWRAREPEHLDAFLEDVQSRFAIDPERIILTGISMGGRAAWEWAAARPGRFAAVVPVCGRLDPSLGQYLDGQPVWIWHGDCDGTVPVYYADLAVASARKAGVTVRYNVIAGEGHDAWDHAYKDPHLIDWMLEHRRACRPILKTPRIEIGLSEGLLFTGQRTEPAFTWCFLETVCEGHDLHRTLYLKQIQLFGTLRARQGVLANRFSIVLVEHLAKGSGATAHLSIGLPLTGPPGTISGMESGRLPSLRCATADYRGRVSGLGEALDALSSRSSEQGHRVTGHHRMLIRFINRDLDYIDAELQVALNDDPASVALARMSHRGSLSRWNSQPLSRRRERNS